MKPFDPVTEIENASLILDEGNWPNFHDAEVHQLIINRGDVRPEDDVWIGTSLEVTFELCALKHPYLVTLKFHDCEDIELKQFNQQNALYDLHFALEPRGFCRDGTALTPYIIVHFEQAFGMKLGFKCFRISCVARQ